MKSLASNFRLWQIALLSLLLFANCKKKECPPFPNPISITILGKKFETEFNNKGELVYVYRFAPGGTSPFFGDYPSEETIMNIYREAQRIRLKGTSGTHSSTTTFHLDDQGRCIKESNPDALYPNFYHYNADGYLDSVTYQVNGVSKVKCSFSYENGNLVKAKRIDEEYEFEYDTLPNNSPYNFQFKLIEDWMPFLSCFGKTNANNPVKFKRKYEKWTEWQEYDFVIRKDDCNNPLEYTGFRGGYIFQY